MIAETLMRLSPFRRVRTYRYIGFGSTFYSDFSLFHRILGCKPMFSMQKRFGDEARFDFNLPLGCITNRFGHSNNLLYKFPWNGIASIVWLDYDEELQKYMLDDVGYLSQVLTSSSILMVTVKSKGADFGDTPKARLQLLNDTIQEKMPLDISESDVINARFHGAIRRIFYATIKDKLSKRNSGVKPKQCIQYEQIMYFTYNDSTPMVTFGGLILKENQRDSFLKCDFKSLDFTRFGNTPYNIFVPNLTFREQRYLDQQLPGDRINLQGVPKDDLEAYSKLYRYFPRFVEAEL